MNISINMPGQNRIRDSKKYLDNGVKYVDEKWTNLGVLSVFGHAIEENGVITDFAFTGPDGTNVERVLKDIPKEFLDKLLEAAYLDNAERIGTNLDELIAKRRNVVEEAGEEASTNDKDAAKDDLLKPCKPIYVFSELDMRSFFPRFVRSVLKRENVAMQGKTLWATSKKDEEGRELIKPPVKVPFWNKNIINPSFFFGMGKKYQYGNILHRQIMQVANILILNNINPDEFCEIVPNGYVPKNYTLEDIIAMGSDVENIEVPVPTFEVQVVPVPTVEFPVVPVPIIEVPVQTVEVPVVPVPTNEIQDTSEMYAIVVESLDDAVFHLESIPDNIAMENDNEEIEPVDTGLGENENQVNIDQNVNTPAKDGPVVYGTHL